MGKILKQKSALIIGIGIFILLYIVPLGVRPMSIPDEFRYAEIPREMLETGNWIVPHLDGLRYFEKPVLGCWLNAIAIAIFGENTFAVRFPSAIAVGLTALLLFVFVRKFSEDDLMALLTAAIFLLSLEVLAIGTFCVLDSVLSLFVTSSIVFFYWAYKEDKASKKNILLALAGLSCGLAFLTKGFLALVVPMIVIIPFMFWQGRLKTFLRTIWIPLIVMPLVVVPWSIAIHFREPDFWRYFFWVEHVDRFISPNGGQHPYPFWFYIPVIIGGAMPWTFLIGPVVQGLKSVDWKAPMFRLVLCWLGLPFLFFSVSSGKLGTYILPCFPPLAILTSMGLLNYFSGEKRKAFTIGDYTMVAIIVILIILLLLHQTMPAGSKLYGQQETWKIALVVIAFMTWVVFLHFAGRAADFRRKLAFFAVGPAIFMFCIHFIIPEQLVQKKTPGEFLRQHQDRINQDTLLVSDNYLAPAVCWNYKRNDVYLLDRTGEFTYGLGYDDSKHRLLDIDHLIELIMENTNKKCVTLITFTKRYIEYEHLLPKPAFKEIHHGFVFVQFVPPIPVTTEITMVPAMPHYNSNNSSDRSGLSKQQLQLL